jgi:hypothetical protein
VTLPAAVYPLVKTSGRLSAFIIQSNTLIVTAGGAVFWPAYLVVVVPLIALSRFYHRRRFGITYPGPTKIV